MRRPSHLALICVALVSAIPSTAGAQPARGDRLRVLRFEPSRLADPRDSLVIAFDHPVAQRLDRSVDPARVVRVEPSVSSTAYWRDPSTLVVRFVDPLPFEARYMVSIRPTLRSADGVPLVEGQQRELRVRKPGLLLVFPSGGRTHPDGWQRPFVVYEAPVPLGALQGRLVAEEHGACVAGTIFPLHADSIRPILASDPDEVRNAPGLSRDRRRDGLRRVVRFSANAPIPQGCTVTAWVSGEPDGAERAAGPFRILPRFALSGATCADSPCRGGNLVLVFSAAVRGDEVRRHIRVDGRPASPRSVAQNDANAQSVWQLEQTMRPGAFRTVTADADLTDALGRRLGIEATLLTRAEPARPDVAFLTGPVIVPRDGDMLFAVRHVNTDSIVVTIGRVADSLRARLVRHQWNVYNATEPQMERDSVVRVAATPAPLDSDAVFVVPTSWIPRAWRDEPLLLIRARPRHPDPLPAHARWSPYAAIQRTTMAAHALYGQGTLDVWVTSLRDAAAIPRARLRLLQSGNRAIASGSTDERGRAQLRFERPAAERWEQHALLEVTARGERLLLALPGGRSLAPVEREGRYRWDQRAGGDLLDGRTLHGVAFADRGIYRPGEHLFLKGMVRTSRAESGFVTPAGDSVRWTLSTVGASDALERIAQRSAVLTAFGTTDAGFDLPRTAALGDYTATLSYRTDTTWRIAAQTMVRVAEYRPVEFEVALSVDTTIALFAGDTARLRTSARYLFGMPMDGAALTWSARLEDRPYWSAGPRPPGLEGFDVGRSWWQLGDAAQRPWTPPASGSATLAADGTATIVAPVGAVVSPSTLIVSAVVTDANRQSVSSERRITVHVADTYVGMREKPWRWMRGPGDSIALELLAVRANGALRPGTPITLHAVRYDWSSGRRLDTVWRSSVVSTDSIVRTTFVPTAPGSYEVLASAADERGRVSTSGHFVWVSGAAHAARRGGELTVTMDRETYEPGDTATVVIDAPGERSAWVTLYTSTPLVERQLTLHRGPNVVRIPVPSGAMPTARLGVIAVRPVTVRDTAAGYFTSSERWLSVATSSRALDVRVGPERTRYEPGDTVTLHVRVKDTAGRGRRAEATLWAVDQGVAALTGLEKPDLVEPLFNAADAASTASTLTAPVLGLDLVNNRIPRMERIQIRGMTSSVALSEVVVTGYGEQRHASPARGVLLRSMFATTPFWTANIVTDSAGNATTRFVLPHNVTTFRLFSAAITAGTEVGSGDTSLVTTRPLLVRAALPRVVRQGDTLLAGGVITQDATGRTPVHLAVEVHGIGVDGDAMRDSMLDGRRARELRFPMRVTAKDSVTVTLRADGGGHGDAVRTTLPVSPPGHTRAHVVMGTLEGRADVALPRLDGVDPDRSTVSLQLGVSPLGIVRQLDGALRIYPYYCTEQITSGGRALLARHALERAIDGGAALKAFDREQLERGIAVLVSRQRDDGSIGYWGRSDWSSPWLTAYALSMMLDARDAGIELPASLVSRALTYLSTSKTAQPRTPHGSAGGGTAHEVLAAVRVLRRAGVSDRGLEDSLRALAPSLGYADRLDYAMLRAQLGDSATARAILRDAWRDIRREGRLVRVGPSEREQGWLFPSSVRPAARLFTATAALEPRHPLLGALFESIIQTGRSTPRWQWNTVEQAEVAEAIAAGREVFGFGGARTVTMRAASGAVLATSRFAAGRSDSASFTLAALGTTRDDTPSSLTLDADSSAPIYYAATLFETPRARPVRADDEGISVERWYESYSTGKPIMSVREGELVRVRLRVTMPADREFVAITDPLPAGLEAVDLSLRTSSTLAPFAGAPHRKERDDDAPPGGRWMYGSWDSGWWTPWDHKEIRDDRVHWFARRLWKGSFDISYVARATTAGSFVRPPAYAEEMYNPGVRGRSDGGWFTVTAKP